jgi:glycosyltransferase involved in cell wall biosynthesis
MAHRSGRPTQVFVGAFACSPGRGSEPGVGWEFAKAAACVAQERDVCVTLLTRPHRVSEIKTALAAEGLGTNLRVLGVRVPFELHRLLGHRLIRLTYIAWQFNALREVRRRTSSKEPAMYHHVTFSTSCLPTLVPFLPRQFRVVFGPADGTSESGGFTVRSMVRYALQRTFSVVNVRRGDLLVAQNDRAADEWRRWSARESIRIEPNVVVDEHILRAARPTSTVRMPGKIVSVGLLIPRKRHDLTIRALADERLSEYTLTIVGEGPEREALRALTHELGLADRVRLTGWLARDMALREVADAECFVLASEHEGAPWSVGEAQALGVIPVVRSGTGGATVARLGELGMTFPYDAEPQELADVILSLREAPSPERSTRWSPSRLPRLLSEWYGLT